MYFARAKSGARENKKIIKKYMYYVNGISHSAINRRRSNEVEKMRKDETKTCAAIALFGCFGFARILNVSRLIYILLYTRVDLIYRRIETGKFYFVTEGCENVISKL